MHSSTMASRGILVALAVLMLSACSSVRPYKSELPENMTISTNVSDGTAHLNIYLIDKACNFAYQGTVDLSDKKQSVALPTSKPLYLEFVFSRHSFFTGGHSNSYETYLMARPGHKYEASASYADHMYGADIYEVGLHNRGRHKMPYADPLCSSR